VGEAEEIGHRSSYFCAPQGRVFLAPACLQPVGQQVFHLQPHGVQGLLAVDPVGVGGVGNPGGVARVQRGQGGGHHLAVGQVGHALQPVRHAAQHAALVLGRQQGVGQQCVDGLAAVAAHIPWRGLVPHIVALGAHGPKAPRHGGQFQRLDGHGAAAPRASTASKPPK